MAITTREESERRSAERVTLRCTIYFFVDAAPGVIEATSTNVSSRGLYCNAEVAIPAGERRRCLIGLTPEGFRSSTGTLLLECFLEVLRTEPNDSGYGMGCRIHEYRLMKSELPRLSEMECAGEA